MLECNYCGWVGDDFETIMPTSTWEHDEVCPVCMSSDLDEIEEDEIPF